MKIIKFLILLFVLFFCFGCSSKVSTSEIMISDKTSEHSKEDNLNIRKVSDSKAKEEPAINSNQKMNSEKRNKLIVIDPGHASKANLNREQVAPGSKTMKIKDGGGATGISTKTPEYEINMNVALKLRDFLINDGYDVLMTKDKTDISIGNIERAEIGNKVKADLVIRIHCDSNKNTNAKGASMLVPAKSVLTDGIYSDSKKYGEIILKELIKEVGMSDRGIIYRSDLTGFNWSKVPVVLIEMGFLSNVQEDKLLSSEDYQIRIARALTKGIKESFK